MERLRRKIIIFFLLVSLLFTAFPVSVAADEVGTVSVYTLKHVNTSEYGLADYEWTDVNGNVVELESYSIELYSMRNSDLPVRYSSVDRGYVTPVENQGSTSLCWAYSSLSTIGSYGLKNGFADMKSADFSEAHLGWFSAYPSEDINDTLYGECNPYATDPYKTGGDWDSTAAFLASGKGLAPQSDYSAGIFRPTLNESDRYDRSGGLVTSSEKISTNQDIESVKYSIYEYGAVEAAYYNTVSDHYFGNDEYNIYTSAYYIPSHEGLTNHAISIVGWDDNFSSKNFVTAPPADGAWLVKNSWGTTFGDNGYFWISYYDASLSNFVRYTYVPDGTYENIYQYDGDMADGVLCIEGESFAKQANVFTSYSKETLEAVSFFTLQDSVLATVEIYRNLSEGYISPEDGELVYSSEEFIEYQGYHTIALNDKITLGTDEIFSVVISFETLGTTYIPFNSASEFNQGNGFVLLGSDWNTVNEESGKQFVNVCIKAFTNTVEEPVGDGALRYTVRYHVENINGGYDVISEQHTGAVGETVRASTQLERGLTVNKSLGTLSGVLTEDNSLVLDVYVNRNKYTALLTCDGVTVSKELYLGEPIDFDEFLKDGYLIEWNGDLPETMPARNIEFEGEYVQNDYKIILMVNGIKFKEITVKFGNAIPELPNPFVNFGHFIGWDIDIPTTMPDHDIILNAVISYLEFTVTWNWEGGQRVDEVSYLSQLPEAPQVSDLENGDRFGGWDSEIPNTMPGHDLVFNAVYIPKSYTAEFRVDGEIVGTASFNRNHTAEMLKSEGDRYAKEGYSIEWTPFELTENDIVLEGISVPNVYTVSFVAQDTVVSRQYFTVESFDTVVEPAIPPKVGTVSASWSDYTLSASDITVNAVYVYPVASMSRASRTIYIDKTAKLNVVSNFEINSVTWKTSDPLVATVDSDGKVTAVSEGECFIYAVCRGDDMAGEEIVVTARSKITVKEKIEPEDLSSWFRALFDEFFAVFLHDFAENLKHFFEILLRITR